MKKKILSGVYSGGYTLSAKYDRLTITDSAAITGAVGVAGAYGRSQGGDGGDGGYGVRVEAFGSGVTFKNRGTVVGGVGGVGGDTEYSFPGDGGEGGLGVLLQGAVKFVNRGGTVVGGLGGEGGTPGGDPHNSHGYSGAGGAGLYVGVGGALDNFAGTIIGGAGGAAQSGGQGDGHGGADGGEGAGLGVNVSAVNTGMIMGGAGSGGFAGVYRGGVGGAGGAGLAAYGAATLVNTGTMSGGAGGVGGFTFDGFAAGGTGGVGGAGVILGAGDLTNSGVIIGGQGGAGGLAGYNGPQGAAGAQGDGVVIAHSATLTNGGTKKAAAQIIGAIGVAATAGAVTVVNFGTIRGTGGISVQLGAATDRLIAEAGSTFVGAVVGGHGTLQLAKGQGTITGLGGDGAVSGAVALSFGGFSGFDIDAGGSWSLSGTLTGAVDNVGLVASTGAGSVLQGAVTNEGVLETSGAAASLTVTGSVTGSGSAVVGGGTLDFGSAFSENVTFSAVSGVLELAQSQGFGGTISGFSTSGGTQLDLLDIAYNKKTTQASFSGGDAGGVLTVTDGSHTARITLNGDYQGATFHVAADKQGGTLVTDTIAVAPTVHAFASAMAGMTSAGHAGPVAAGALAFAHGQTMLACPLA